MRILFYTATAVFMVLAGAFGFYALQGPDHAGGAKVVLSIDATEMPPADLPVEEQPDRDLYAEAAARLKSLEGSQSASDEPAADSAEPSSDPIVSEAETARDDSGFADKTDERIADTLDPRDRVDPGELRGSADTSLPEDRAQSEPLPGLPPGTALAGLDNSKPLFKDVETEAQAVAAGEPAAPLGVPGVQLGNVPAASETPADDVRDEVQALPDETGDVPEVQESVADAAPGPEAPSEEPVEAAEPSPAPRTVSKDDVDSVLAALDVKEQPTEPEVLAAPPPPLPLKRPPGTPPPARTAALSGWTSTQITTRESAAQRPPVRIAILVRGMGRDVRNSTDAMTKLPTAISLGFMPFTGSAQELAGKARERGHEVIVQLPLEPSDYPLNNPGPETLLSGASAGENSSRLSTILGRFDGYSGVTNLLGGKLLQSKSALRPILEDLKARGLLYVGEANNSHAVLRGIAGEIGLRYGGADVMIDSNPSPAAIKKSLERLVAQARKDGSAIGMAYASRATIEALEAWSQTLGGEGITLVPVGVLAQTPGAS